MSISLQVSKPRTIRAWDPVVRISHWILALCVLSNWILTKPGSEIHQAAGYTVGGVVLVRLAWGFIGSRYARFSAFPPSLAAARAHVREIRSGDRRAHVSHNPLGALMVYNFWITLGLMVLTGVMMETSAFHHVKWVEAAHSIIFDWLALCVFIHLAGVFHDTRRTGVALVPAMIDGKKMIHASQLHEDSSGD